MMRAMNLLLMKGQPYETMVNAKVKQNSTRPLAKTRAILVHAKWSRSKGLLGPCHVSLILLSSPSSASQSMTRTSLCSVVRIIQTQTVAKTWQQRGAAQFFST